MPGHQRSRKGGELLVAEVQCGNTWQELLGKYDQNTALWKTAQCSLLEDLELSLETWPKWGSMRNGECFRQPMLAQTILENEFGLLEKVPNNLDFFHTPCTTGIDGGSNSRKALKKRIEMWPTPLSSEHKANLNIRENHQNGLTAAVIQKEKSFPTPAARDYKGAVKMGKRITASGKIQNYGAQLPNVVGGNLNPTWVEWLMGWLPGWTDLKPLEMDKYHFVQQQPGDC